MEGEVVEALDCQDGLAEVLELDGDAALGEDAVLFDAYAEAGLREGLVEVALELLAGAAPGNADQRH